MNLDPCIEKNRRRYYLRRPVTSQEREELVTFCTLDPIRELWYCMDRRKLMDWVALNQPSGETAVEPKPPMSRLFPEPMKPEAMGPPVAQKNEMDRPVIAQEENARKFSEACLKLIDFGNALDKSDYSKTTARLYHKDAVEFMRWNLQSSASIPGELSEELLGNYEEFLTSKKTGERTMTRIRSSVKKFLSFLEVGKLKG